MLRSLRLQNYRCFQDHTVTFQNSTVIVGRNNAGKSTIIDALHLVAAVVNRKAAAFVPAPRDLDLPRFHHCIAPKVSHLDLNLATTFHRYGDPPATLTAKFFNGATVQVLVHQGGVHAVIDGPSGPITTKGGFAQLNLPHVHILPQIAPVIAEEGRLNEDYMTGHLYTRLSSRHFRNQLYAHPEHFSDFKGLAESTWPGLRVDRVHFDGKHYTLLVTDGDFAAEVAWMGHGVQMWLQTMWFIAKTPIGSTVVLDEPDVYMHPDLQRKLYRLIKARFAQSAIATHSVEIMAEADPSDILVINNKLARSQYANTEPGVQLLVDQIGGVHNVHLARLWNAKKVLLVEGKDVAYLKTLHAILYPTSDTPLDAIPNLSIGGWGGWAQAQGSSMALKNAVGDRINTYCIFDRDYHTSDECKERERQANAKRIHLHIWERKEIENYLLHPTVIARLIKQRTKQAPPSAVDVTAFLSKACEQEKDTVMDALATHILTENRGLGVGGANKAAREYLNQHWTHKHLHLVSGKALIARLNTWAHGEFGVTIGAMALAKAFRATEIPNEMQRVIAQIEEGTSLD